MPAKGYRTHIYSSARTLQALLDEALFLADALNCKSPDLIVLSGSGKSIKIDEIRQISSFVKYGPAQCKWKLIIVPDADIMTEEASNSFLKTLEEPLDHVLFVLTTTRQSKILKTIASRCQSVLFSNEKRASSEAADKLADILLNIKDHDIPDLLAVSDELSADPDVDGVLNAALYSYREKIGNAPHSKLSEVKEVFSAIRSLERRGNKKLTLDNMFLSLKEVANN